MTENAPTAPRTRSRWRRLARVAAGLVVAICVTALVLVRLDKQVSTPIGSMGIGVGSLPVVELAGVNSDGANFAPLTTALQADDVVMVATPNHGTEIGFLEATLGPGHDKWDGIAGAVPAESPFLDGAARYTFPQTDGQLLRARSVVNLIRTVLALR